MPDNPNLHLVHGDRGPDPNEGRNDPMVEEHWQLGESLQDAIRIAGYEAESVEGIAVDIHDIMQSVDRIRAEFLPRICCLTAEERDELRKMLRELAYEFDHIRWHCEGAVQYLDAAVRQLEG
jgi:hypothetical protein